MSRIMPLLLLLVPLLLAIVAVIGTIATVIRWSFRLSVALVAALLVRVILPAQAGGGWLPLAVFVAVLALFAIGGRRTRREVSSGPRTIDNAPTGPGPAWPALRTMADWRTRRRLDAARNACERYLLLAEAHEDPAAQLPIKIRKHLPSIVSDCVRHCRTATRDEQRALIAETLETVETLAARAENRRRELSHHAQGDFRTLKTHLTRDD